MPDDAPSPASPLCERGLAVSGGPHARWRRYRCSPTTIGIIGTGKIGRIAAQIFGGFDTGALIAALKAGHVGGVALNVYEEEEGIFFEDLSGQVLQDDELSLLLNFPNVLITAHQAFLTVDALSEIVRVTTANLLLLEAGEAFLAESTL